MNCGLIHPITFAEYSKIEGVNQSTLKRFGMAPTPMHFEHENKTPCKETPELRIGKAVDCMVFRPNDYANEFALWSGIRRGKEWDAFEGEHAGKTILNNSEAIRVEGCFTALSECPDFQKCLKISSTQVAAVVEDKVGCTLKALIDILPPHNVGWVFDLKTAATAEPLDFGKSAHNLGYEIQAALTLHILRLLGQPREFFGLYIVENEAPFAVNRQKFSADCLAVEDAMRRIRTWLPRYLECKRTNEWPGYGSEWQEVAVPAWALRNI